MTIKNKTGIKLDAARINNSRVGLYLSFQNTHYFGLILKANCLGGKIAQSP